MNPKRSLTLCARAGLGVLVLIAAAAPARAATITYAFTGEVIGVSSAFGSQIAAGDTISGTFVYDSDAPGSVCGTYCQSYSSPLTVLSATIGSYSFSATVQHQLSEFSTFFDEYSVNALTPSISGPPLNGLTLVHFFLTLFDPTHTALSTMHTLTPPVFGDYAQRTFGLGFLDSAHQFQSIGGRLTSLSEVQTPPAAVPEPTSLLLLGTGIAGLAARARRRRGARAPRATRE